MNFSISVTLDLPIVNLVQIMIYKSVKKGKCSCNSCNTLKVQKKIITRNADYSRDIEYNIINEPAST